MQAAQEPIAENSHNAPEHNNLGASIRRHVRRNRNLFSGNNTNQRSQANASNNTHSNQQAEPREQDPLLEEGK